MSNTSLNLRALRGATTASANTAAAMSEAVDELLDALINSNGLQGGQVLSATFSVTSDLDAMFPASLARRRPGWDGVALLVASRCACRETYPAAFGCWCKRKCQPSKRCITPICATPNGYARTDPVTTDS